MVGKGKGWKLNSTVSLVTEVEVATEVVAADGAAVAGTMEETGLMDHR